MKPRFFCGRTAGPLRYGPVDCRDNRQLILLSACTSGCQPLASRGLCYAFPMSPPALSTKFERLHAAVFTILCTGEYRPGDKIGIKDLAGRLGVSTTPLREILSRLAGRGVIEERRAEGFYLARLDARDIADLYTLHSLCVLRGLRRYGAVLPDALAASSPWNLFARIAQASGDIAIIEARALLDDRLRVVRRIEETWVSDQASEFERMRHVAANGPLRETAIVIRRFHDRRRAQAPAIASALTRNFGFRIYPE